MPLIVHRRECARSRKAAARPDHTAGIIAAGAAAAPTAVRPSLAPVERTAKSAEGGALSVAVHPDGASQDGLPHFPDSPECMHGTVSRRLADGISPRPPFAWPSPKNVLFISAANNG